MLFSAGPILFALVSTAIPSLAALSLLYKRQYDRLKKAEDHSYALFDSSSVPKWFVDAATGEVTRANNAAVDLFGSPGGQSPYRRSDLPVPHASTTHESIIGGRPRHFELNCREVLIRGARNFLVHALEITERVEVRRALVESELHCHEKIESQSSRLTMDEHLRLVVEKAGVGLAVIDQTRRFAFTNEAFRKIFDLPSSDVVGARVSSVLGDAYENQIATRLDTAFDGESVEFELRRSQHGRNRRYYDVRYEPVKINGSVPLIVAAFSEISERVEADRERQAVEEKYRTLFEYGRDGIIVADPDSRYVDVNQNICAMLGYTRDELIGRLATEFVIPREVPHLGQTWRGLNADLEYFNDWEFRCADGASFPADVTSTRMPDGNTLIIVRDISERTALQQQLLQAHKMGSLGVFAGGIAHDFNNMIGAIQGYGELALQRIAEEDPVREFVLEIRESGKKASDLTKQLLAFSRKQEIVPVDHNVNHDIRDTEKMLRRILARDIKVDIDLAPELGSVKADRGQISQVILNLVANAGDAMPDGGTITVRTRDVFLSDDFIRDHMGRAEGPHVEIEVRDTGCGMDEQTRRRLFEPFYTTKEVGKGTGLGLSTVHSIVERIGGCIAVDTEPGRGTTFHVYLPVAAEAAETNEATRTSRTQNAAPTSSTRILLVVSDRRARNHRFDTLSNAGYTVLEAESAEAALAIASLTGGGIDLLLCDRDLPTMRGEELASKLAASNAGIRLLFLSPDPANDTATPYSIIHASAGPADLIRKVTEVLTADPAVIPLEPISKRMDLTPSRTEEPINLTHPRLDEAVGLPQPRSEEPVNLGQILAEDLFKIGQIRDHEPPKTRSATAGNTLLSLQP